MGEKGYVNEFMTVYWEKLQLKGIVDKPRKGSTFKVFLKLAYYINSSS